MAPLFYGLCTLTALFCAVLLLRAYSRSRYRLLLWGGLCFAGLTLNNLLLITDKLLLPYIGAQLLLSCLFGLLLLVPILLGLSILVFVWIMALEANYTVFNRLFFFTSGS